MQQNIFCVREFIKTESRELLYRVRFVSVSTFNISNEGRRTFVLWITNLSKYSCLCKGQKLPVPTTCIRRRTWDEFKTVLSVARCKSNPYSERRTWNTATSCLGVCWGAVYCSSHIWTSDRHFGSALVSAKYVSFTSRATVSFSRGISCW